MDQAAPSPYTPPTTDQTVRTWLLQGLGQVHRSTQDAAIEIGHLLVEEKRLAKMHDEAETQFGIGTPQADAAEGSWRAFLPVVTSALDGLLAHEVPAGEHIVRTTMFLRAYAYYVTPQARWRPFSIAETIAFIARGMPECEAELGAALQCALAATQLRAA